MTAWDFTCNNTNTISQVVNFNSTFSTATATVPPDTLLCSSPPFNMDLHLTEALQMSFGILVMETHLRFQIQPMLLQIVEPIK